MGKRLLIVLLLFIGAAMADGVYKWVDEQGHTVYSDKPPAGKSARQIEVPAQPGPQAVDADRHGLPDPRDKPVRHEPQEVLGTFSLGFATVAGAPDFPQPPFRLTAVVRSIERAMNSRLGVNDLSPEWRRDADNVVSSHQDFSFHLRPGSYELVAIEVDAPSLSDTPFEYPAAARRFVVPEGSCVYIGRIYFVFHRLPPLPFGQAEALARQLADKAGRQAFVFHYLPRGALIPWEFGVDTPAVQKSGQEVKPGQQALARARERGCVIKPAGS
jgi:hypothetical protein